MPAPRRTLTLLLTALALGAAGCGQGGGDSAMDDASGSNGDNELASSDAAEVLQARRTIDAACGSDGAGTPDRSASAIGTAVSTLTNLTTQYPNRVFETGNEDRAEKMSTVTSQVAVQLRRCGIADQADRLAKLAD